MRQHPIPQNVLDIEFKLFTKFTVREFVYMATGIGFGGIFLYLYTRGDMPAILALPIFLVSSGIGLFLGLVPINDQTADIFLRNYIIAITRPTRRVWRSKKMSKEANKQMISGGLEQTRGTMERDLHEKKQAEIVGASPVTSNQFIEDSTLTQLEQEEQDRLESITKQMQNPQTTLIQQPSSTPQQSQVVRPTAKPATDKVQRPVVVPRVSIDNINISQYKADQELNSVLVVDNNNVPINQAIVVFKDDNGKLLYAQRSDSTGKVKLNKEYSNTKLIITAAHPNYLFAEISYTINGPFIPIKISPIK